MKKTLWEQICVPKNATRQHIDKTYFSLQHNPATRLAWKVLRDDFYRDIYAKYEDLAIVEKAGFLEDNFELQDISLLQDITFRTTPLPLIKNLPKNAHPIVLLSTGGFCPLHEGHLQMMYLAKAALESAGKQVVGGYFSISHPSYVNTKTNVHGTPGSWLYDLQKHLTSHPWLLADPGKVVMCLLSLILQKLSLVCSGICVPIFTLTRRLLMCLVLIMHGLCTVLKNEG